MKMGEWVEIMNDEPIERGCEARCGVNGPSARAILIPGSK
jgi:hypothetical protein